MPTHTPASALIKLFFAIPGAPWIYPRWLEITGLDHPFNHPDDAKLPPDLTRQKVRYIESYFSQYYAKATEDEKIKFAMKAPQGEDVDTVPGREEWRKWVTKKYSTKWKIHSRISKILSFHGIHPEQLMDESGETSAPSSASYLPIVLDEIGRELFGPHALDSNKRLLLKLRDPTMILAQRTWTLQLKGVEPRKNKLEKLLQQAVEKISNLEAGVVTVKSINQAIRAVADFEKASYAPQHFASLEQLKEHLDRFIPEEPVKSKSGARGVKKQAKPKKVTKEKLAQSATPEEVARLIQTYDLYFGHSSGIVEELEIEEPQGVTFGQPVEGADPGVEIEAGMTCAELAASLGLGPGNMPFLFNRFRHPGGFTAWTKEFKDACQFKPESLEKFSLQWHQLCGVHAALRKIFTTVPKEDHCTGVLFADDVGLGKTIQSSAVMAILSDVCVQQTRNLTLPPIIRDLPYLKDLDKIPSLPHLVVAPGTLLRQWEHEVQCFFKSKSVDILLYESGIQDHELFWKEGGTYHSSNHPPSHRIILAAQSALQQDFGQLYTSNRRSLGLPWELPERTLEYKRRLPFTIFQQQFLTVTIDEAQCLRNPGAKHSAALRILDQGLVRLILTATPLQTSTKDIAAMGRLTGLPYFFSELGCEEQTADNAQLRRARIEKGGDPEAFDPEDDPVKLAQVEISKRLATRFQGRIIRRVATSLDVNGDPLISLPPINIIEGVLHLTEREQEILEEITLDGLGNASDANIRNITSQTFYLEHRMGVTFARENFDDPLPVFKTIEEWEKNLGTKINVLVIVSKYILTRDDMPPVRFEDGQPIFSPPPSTLRFTQLIKIVIYQEFPSHTPLVINIFKLHGIKVLSICGNDGFEQRAKTVQKFNENPEYRVLIFSKVGSTGLNLTRASVIILLDQPWSAQDERQIYGRVWRQRQLRPVTAIRLLAAETADITLSSLAQGKRDMLDAFLTTDTSKALLSVMTGDVLTNADGEEVEEVFVRAVSKKTSKQRASTKKQKAPAKKQADPTGRAKGRKPRKSAPIISDDEDEPINRAVSQPPGEPGNVSDASSEPYDTDLSIHAASTSERSDSSTSALSGLSANESSEEEMEELQHNLSLLNHKSDRREEAQLKDTPPLVSRVANDGNVRKPFFHRSEAAQSADAVGRQSAKKRARAKYSPSPPPPQTSLPINDINTEPPPLHNRQQPVIKKARLQADFEPSKAHCSLHRMNVDDEDHPFAFMLPPSPTPSRHQDNPTKPRRGLSSQRPQLPPHSQTSVPINDPFASHNEQESVIKKARLQAASRVKPSKSYSTLQAINVDDEGRTHTLMQPPSLPLTSMEKRPQLIDSESESRSRQESSSTARGRGIPEIFRRKPSAPKAEGEIDSQMPFSGEAGRKQVSRQPTAFPAPALVPQPFSSRLPPAAATSRPNPNRQASNKNIIPRR